MREFFRGWQLRRRRKKYRVGVKLSRFIARDVRREIEIVSVERLDEGVIIGRVRTSNVLYATRGLVPESGFEPARELRIDEMWKWSGQSWGGLADGTSLAAKLLAADEAASRNA